MSIILLLIAANLLLALLAGAAGFCCGVANYARFIYGYDLRSPFQ